MAKNVHKLKQAAKAAQSKVRGLEQSLDLMKKHLEEKKALIRTLEERNKPLVNRIMKLNGELDEERRAHDFTKGELQFFRLRSEDAVDWLRRSKFLMGEEIEDYIANVKILVGEYAREDEKRARINRESSGSVPDDANDRETDSGEESGARVDDENARGSDGPESTPDLPTGERPAGVALDDVHEDLQGFADI